jgi:hypothetical protein
VIVLFFPPSSCTFLGLSTVMLVEVWNLFLVALPLVAVIVVFSFFVDRFVHVKALSDETVMRNCT